MKYLLDTHIALWSLGDENNLSERTKSVLDDLSNILYISIISVWEIALKINTEKLIFAGGPSFFLEQMKKNGIKLLNIKGYHINYLENLPFHHRDPFDRLLIAAAATEGLTLITADKNIHQYEIPYVW